LAIGAVVIEVVLGADQDEFGAARRRSRWEPCAANGADPPCRGA
jgi:hypothetical protein